MSKFIALNQSDNLTHWQKSFGRSIADLTPLLPLGAEKPVLLDYVLKIVGIVFTFGFISYRSEKKI
jgi:hypothetical protein